MMYKMHPNFRNVKMGKQIFLVVNEVWHCDLNQYIEYWQDRFFSFFYWACIKLFNVLLKQNCKCSKEATLLSHHLVYLVDEPQIQHLKQIVQFPCCALVWNVCVEYSRPNTYRNCNYFTSVGQEGWDLWLGAWNSWTITMQQGHLFFLWRWGRCQSLFLFTTQKTIQSKQNIPALLLQ